MVLGRRIKEQSREERKRRKVRPIVVIICEGKETEPLYFTNFASRCVNVQVK